MMWCWIHGYCRNQWHYLEGYLKDKSSEFGHVLLCEEAGPYGSYYKETNAPRQKPHPHWQPHTYLYLTGNLAISHILSQLSETDWALYLPQFTQYSWKIVVALVMSLEMTGNVLMILKCTILEYYFSDRCTIIAWTWQELLAWLILWQLYPWLV